MGGDGGSIPSRVDQVKTKKKLERIDREFAVAIRWRNCALSQDRLHTPLVACKLGRIYNKEAIIEAILNKGLGDHAVTSHIRSLKDVKELNLTPNPAFNKEKLEVGTSDSNTDTQMGEFICPVLGVEMNGFHRFSVIWTCGCVCSEKALKELKTTSCFKCGKPFDHTNVVILNGDENEVAQLRQRMLTEQSSKRAKKHKSASSSGAKAQDVDVKTEEVPVNADGNSGHPEQKATSSKSAQSNGGPTDAKQRKVDSIQDNPKVSAAVKSLFTSSAAGKKQATKISGQFWVTHDPTHY